MNHIVTTVVLLAGIFAGLSDADADPARWERLSSAGAEALAAGRLAVAEQRFAEALREAESSPTRDVRLIIGLSNLANVYRRLGNDDKAIILYTRAVAAAEEMNADYDIVLNAFRDLAWFYQERRRHREAGAVYARAADMTIARFGRDDPRVAALFTIQADAWKLQREYDKAVDLLRVAVVIFETSLGPNDASVAVALSDLALLLRARGDDREGAALAQRAAAIFRKASENAELLLQAAASVRERVLGSDHPVLLKSLYDLAMFLRANGRYREALTIHERVLQIVASMADNALLMPLFEDQADLFERTGHEREARVFQARAAALRAQRPTRSTVLPEHLEDRVK